MNFKSIISKRRDGGLHSESELQFLANGAAYGSIPDYQLAAWLMAAYLNPLTIQETSQLTKAMADSGERLNLSGIPKPWVDKHSTGGVGDKTSIVLLPILAACGLTVLKMSGRGLGITGGTLDKLSSVPGFSTDLSTEELLAQAKEIGIALAGQTASLGPADKVLYSLRDATETVPSLPLIVSSILSKKIAGGAETVVLDVKCGSGSFNKSLAEATRLAEALKSVGEEAGLRVFPVITDMSQPLGAAVGNAIEVREALDVLSGKSLPLNVARFKSLCIELAGLTLWASGKSSTRELGKSHAEDALADGRAFLKASEWFKAQGATDPLIDYASWLILSPFQATVVTPSSGWIAEVDAERVGELVVQLGGGRLAKSDAIDTRVGVEILVQVGERVDEGSPIATVYAKSHGELEDASQQILSAVKVSTSPVEEVPIFLASEIG